MSSLLEIAKQYQSEEEFKTKNFPKWLLAKNARILTEAFPPPKEKVVYKGLYFIYSSNNSVLYINHSSDIHQSIREIVKEGVMPIAKAKFFRITNDSDAMLASLYYILKYRPQYNTEYGRYPLTIHLSLNGIKGNPTYIDDLTSLDND